MIDVYNITWQGVLIHMVILAIAAICAGKMSLKEDDDEDERGRRG